MGCLFPGLCTCRRPADLQPGYLTWTPVRDESYKKTGEAVTLDGKHCGTWTSDMFNVEETEEGTQ